MTKIIDRPQQDLAARVAQKAELAAIPAYTGTVHPADFDVEAWNEVGDPITEALVRDLTERKRMGGDIYATTRELAAEGLQSAIDFLTDVETVPDWLDFDALYAGAEMSKRNPVGILLGMHGALAYTYIDPATAAVMASSGRLSGERGAANFDRRFWETAAGFVGPLDVDSMRPGGAAWEKWVRIRLLHTMIRMGISRSGHWDHSLGMPIGQPATGVGAYIFGAYRVSIIRALGGYVTDEEQRSCALMWRWVARLEGTNSEVLGSWPDGQQHNMNAITEYLYRPDQASIEVTNGMIDGLTAMSIFSPLPRRIHAAVLRHVMSERWMGVLPGQDVPASLGFGPDRPADLAVRAFAAGFGLLNQGMRIPAVRHAASRVGGRLVDRIVERGLAGVAPNFRPE